MSDTHSSDGRAETQGSVKYERLLPPVKYPEGDEFLLASEAMTPLINLMAELFGVDNIPSRRHLESTAIRLAGEGTLGGKKLTGEQLAFYHTLVSSMHGGVDAMYTVLMAAFQLGNHWHERSENSQNGDPKP